MTDVTHAWVTRDKHVLLHHLLTTLDRLREVQYSEAAYLMILFTPHEVDTLERALSDHGSYDVEEIADALAATDSCVDDQHGMLWRYGQMRQLKKMNPELFAKLVALKPEWEGEEERREAAE